LLGDGSYDWTGILTVEEMPNIYNPKQGWFASANEMNLPADYPYKDRKISFSWSDSYRHDRIAEMLSRIDLRGHRLGLQLYPDKDHGVLIGAIKAQGAEVDTVLPYVYDAQAADANIVTAIDEMAAGRIDAIALTNLGQVRRLVEVARARGCEARLRDGLARTPIASVGPVVSDELKSHGLRTDISPANEAYFMKPLISAMATTLGKAPPRTGKR